MKKLDLKLGTKMSSSKDSGKERTKLKYIEFHIVDRCNLNCNGCSHLSPLVKEDFDHLSFFKHDLSKLKSLFDSIDDIHLLGGEPLLEKKLDEYLVFARNTYKDARIEITTNGLLIPSIDEKLLLTAKENSIEFNVSLYPPTEKIIGLIKDRLESFGIKYSISNPISVFRKKIHLDGAFDPDDAYKKCTVGRNCTFAYKGNLFLCSGAALIHYFNDYFGTRINCRNAFINLDDPNISSEKVLEFLSHGNDSCRYCGTVAEEEWSICHNPKKADIKHWIVE